MTVKDKFIARLADAGLMSAGESARIISAAHERARAAERLAIAKHAIRMYSGAKQSRLTDGWANSNTSADAELVSSLTALRSRSRALVRDAGFAKRAKVLIQNNLIGSGIGMQGQVKGARGKLNKRINDAIEAAFCEWSLASNCHTGGAMHLADLERFLVGQVFEAGEVLVRKHYSPFGDSIVPLAIEVMEPERLADDRMVAGPLAAGNTVRMGVELDSQFRAVAYWLRRRHPGELRWNEGPTDQLERVPADQIYHLRIVDRWPQTRGEPWMHAALRKLNDLDGYTEAEIVAARSAASYMGVIESPEPPAGAEAADGSTELALEPGLVQKLAPGEKFSSFMPNRPNSGAEPFLRFMLREIAASIGCSYESLARDYSQSNYSSSRLALLDDRELYRLLQGWFIRSFREPLHREFMQAAVLSRAIPAIDVRQYALDPAKFCAVRFKPRGWSWIDPTKEVEAYRQAVAAGFTTVSDVIALTGSGRDIEDVLDERRSELDLMAEKQLTFELSNPATGGADAPAPGQQPDKGKAGPAEPDDDDTESDKPARAARRLVHLSVR